MNRRVVVVLLLWLVAAITVVVSGALHQVPPPFFLISLAAASTAAALVPAAARHWADGVELRLLLLPHLVRFVGIYLVSLVESGQLPQSFLAIGWGDFFAALGASVLFLIGAPRERNSVTWWLWLSWSVFGIGDMALLVSRAAPAALADPAQFRPFFDLPLGLLPTFVVPLILTSHVLIVRRLLSRNPKATK